MIAEIQKDFLWNNFSSFSSTKTITLDVDGLAWHYLATIGATSTPVTQPIAKLILDKDLPIHVSVTHMNDRQDVGIKKDNEFFLCTTKTILCQENVS